MDEDRNLYDDDFDNNRINEEDISEVFEIGDLPGDEVHSDDEDQQSTSNMSGVEEPETVDDSLSALQAHEQDCFAIKLASQRWLISGGEDDVAYLWDKTKSESDPVLKISHDDSVTAVGFNNNETMVATGDMGGKIRVTNLASLETVAEFSDCNDLEWMAWHNSSDILFAGDKDGIIWMWLISNKGVVQSKVFAGNGSPCTVGHLLPDGRRLLAGYADGIVRLWSLKDQTSSQMDFREAITAIEHHLTQPVAAVGNQSGTVNIINTSQETLRKVMVFPKLGSTTRTENEEDEPDIGECVECLAMAPNHPWLAVGRNDGSLCVYELDTSSPRSIYRSPSGQAIVKAVWSMEGLAPLLSVGSVDGTIRIFDARDGSLHKELGNGGDEVLDMLVIDRNPLRLMTAACGGVIRVFDLSQVP